MDLAEKIKVLRLKNALTQAQLADLVGVSRQAEAKWESGASAPDILKIRDLAKALGTTSDVLLSPDPLQEDEAKTPTGVLSNKVTLKVFTSEIPEVNALMSAIGYVSASPKGEGGLILLNPTAFFASHERAFVHLGFALEPAELVNADHEKRRSSLRYGAEIQSSLDQALSAEESIAKNRHLARGIVYVCFAPLSATIAVMSFVYAPIYSPFFLLLAFPMAAFTALFIIQGIRWIRSPRREKYPQGNARYQSALDQLLSYAAKDKALLEANPESVPSLSVKPLDSSSIVDTLTKAQALRDSGAISAEEYEKIKKKTLSGS